MRFLKPFLLTSLLAMSLGLLPGAAAAGPGNPQNNVDYLTLAKPQPAESGKRIEVIEFFGYFCPHCHAFDPVLTDWVNKHGDNIAFKRIHVVFRPAMLPFQQMYITLDVLGKTHEVHSKIFHAMHNQRLALTNESQILDFLVKQGIEREQYLEIYNSFSVQGKMRSLTRMQEAFGIDGVPMIAIDGRFVTSPEILRGSIGSQPEKILHLATLQVMEALVLRVMRERGMPVPAK